MKKNPKQDRKTVSDAIRETKALADKLNVPLYVVYLAKEKSQSNDREVLTKWIEERKGGTYECSF